MTPLIQFNTGRVFDQNKNTEKAVIATQRLQSITNIYNALPGSLRLAAPKQDHIWWKRLLPNKPESYNPKCTEKMCFHLSLGIKSNCSEWIGTAKSSPQHRFRSRHSQPAQIKVCQIKAAELRQIMPAKSLALIS